MDVANYKNSSVHKGTRRQRTTAENRMGKKEQKRKITQLREITSLLLANDCVRMRYGLKECSDCMIADFLCLSPAFLLALCVVRFGRLLDWLCHSFAVRHKLYTRDIWGWSLFFVLCSTHTTFPDHDCKLRWIYSAVVCCWRDCDCCCQWLFRCWFGARAPPQYAQFPNFYKRNLHNYF